MHPVIANRSTPVFFFLRVKYVIGFCKVPLLPSKTFIILCALNTALQSSATSVPSSSPTSSSSAPSSTQRRDEDDGPIDMIDTDTGVMPTRQRHRPVPPSTMAVSAMTLSAAVAAVSFFVCSLLRFAKGRLSPSCVGADFAESTVSQGCCIGVNIIFFGQLSSTITLGTHEILVFCGCLTCSVVWCLCRVLRMFPLLRHLMRLSHHSHRLANAKLRRLNSREIYLTRPWLTLTTVLLIVCL